MNVSMVWNIHTLLAVLLFTCSQQIVDTWTACHTVEHVLDQLETILCIDQDCVDKETIARTKEIPLFDHRVTTITAHSGDVYSSIPPGTRNYKR